MASSIRADRLRARDKYMAELDRRFPGKHQERAPQPGVTSFCSKTSSAGPSSWPVLRWPRSPTSTCRSSVASPRWPAACDDDLEAGRDLEATVRWRQFAETLEEEAKTNEDIRAWKLYADKQAAALQAEIELRLKTFTAAMQRFTAAQFTGNARDVERIGREIIDQFGRYQSLERPIWLCCGRPR